MKIRQLMKKLKTKSRIFGSLLIIIGMAFFLNPTPLNIKLGFASFLIGLFTILIIEEKKICNDNKDFNPFKIINDFQIKENICVIKKIIKELNLKGNAVFLNKSKTLSEERIIIPVDESGIIKIPDITNDQFFLGGADKKNMGISVPPSGLRLLNEIEKDGYLENTDVKKIDKKLQIFVKKNLVKGLSFKKEKNNWVLELESPVFLTNDLEINRQYPSPICSAILTAITRASNKKICILDAKYDKKKITFYLNFLKKKQKKEINWEN